MRKIAIDHDKLNELGDMLSALSKAVKKIMDHNDDFVKMAENVAWIGENADDVIRYLRNMNELSCFSERNSEEEIVKRLSI